MKKIYLLAISCLIFSSLLKAQWIREDGPSSEIYSLAASDVNLFAGNNHGIIFRSTNSSTSWIVVYTGLTNTRTDAIAISGTNVFAANDASVLRSTNNGSTWATAGLTTSGPQALAISPNGNGSTDLFAGTFQSGVFLSTNDGTSWTAVNSGLTGSSMYITALFVSDTNLFAGTWGGSAFRSTNDGITWTSVKNGLTSNNIHAFTSSRDLAGGTNIFAGTYFSSGVYLSTDNGENWTTRSTGLTNNSVRALACSDKYLFAGTYGGGVFRSTDNGISWTVFNTGLTNLIVNALIISDTVLFAGTNDGVWRRSLNDMITYAADQFVEIPSKFLLEQNYPNPFNPNTSISYQLPESGKITLMVYDIIGTEIIKLVNEEKLSGIYEVNLNAANLPSGIYFYQLRAGDFVQTKKMILMK